MQREAVPPLPRVLPGAGCSIKKAFNFVTICAHVAIGTVPCHVGRSTIGFLMSCTAESHISAFWVAGGVAVYP